MEKPRLSFWHIWNMSFGFFGIQFGWGLQMANMSAIYEYLGAKPDEIPILWLAAPLTGLIVQPIIGYFSDRTWNRLGRRRPYFLLGAILASAALLAMPNSGTIWMAAGLLWVLDASVNISMEPFRAFVADMLPSEQRKIGFSMQALLIGAGAVISSALPYILKNGFGVSGESTMESAIPPVVHLAFSIGAVVFFLAVLYTILTTREYPPEDLEAFARSKRESAGVGRAFREIFVGIGSMPGPMRKLALVQFFTWFALFCMWIYFAPGVARSVFEGVPLGAGDAAMEERLNQPGSASVVNQAALVARNYEGLKERLDKEAKQKDGGGVLRGLGAMLGLVTQADAAASITPGQLQTFLEEAQTARSLPAASTRERESALVRTIASLLVEKGSAGAPEVARALGGRLAVARRYQDGVNWAGVCFSTYNLVAFGFAFVLLAVARRFSARSIHLLCLTIGGLGLLSVLAVGSPKVLLLSMVGVGIAWASILAMPYAMLSNALPADKMGFYMGVFNFFIVLPQILASVGMGSVMGRFLGNDPTKALLLGGVSMLLAAVLTLRLKTSETE